MRARHLVPVVRRATCQADGVQRQKRVQVFLDSLATEVFVLVAVAIYAILIFVDLGTNEVFFPGGCDVSTQCKHPHSGCAAWLAAFVSIDCMFLSFFATEIAARLYAFGCRYLRDWFTCFDAIIIGLSLSFLVWQQFTRGCQDAADPKTNDISTAARLIRILRVFRLLTVMNKIIRTRQTANIIRQKAKYRRLGSHVERVLEILMLLRGQIADRIDRENLNFIIDCIVSDQLYVVYLPIAESRVSLYTRANSQNESSVKLRSPSYGRRSSSWLEFRSSIYTDSQLKIRNPKDRPSGVSRANSDLPSWIRLMLSAPDVERLLQGAMAWGFDVWALDAASNGNSLVAIVVHYVYALNLDVRLGLDLRKLVSFLVKLQAGYNRIPFHNHIHAADVVHGTVFFALHDAVRRHLTPLDLYAIILAAAMHDHGHMGYTNAFHINAHDELAITYNDMAVLESFHLASSWRLTLDVDSDPFAGFGSDQYTDARQTIVQAILGSEMSLHFDHLTKFKTHSSSGAFDTPDRAGVRELLTMCLHAADVSNPSKPWALCSNWAARVMMEFFTQGDKERELGLVVSPFMDRYKTDIAQCQIGFVDFLIRPFFEEWTGWLGDHTPHEILGHITANLAIWRQDGEGALGEQMLAAVKTHLQREQTPVYSSLPFTNAP